MHLIHIQRLEIGQSVSRDQPALVFSYDVFIK